MKKTSTFILESKLKRHKISYVNENGKIIIGKSKIDLVILIGLVIFPIIAGLSLIFFFFIKNQLIIIRPGKIILIIISLIATGVFYASRLITKKKHNSSLKILDYKIIKIKNNDSEETFNSRNTKRFDYNVQEINDEIYQGNLYLVDNNENKHMILGFDDEQENYVEDDLKWFSEYMSKHIKLKNITNQ